MRDSDLATNVWDGQSLGQIGSASRRICATSWAVLRLLMSPSVAQSTGGLSFRLDQILGSRPKSGESGVTLARSGVTLYARVSHRKERDDTLRKGIKSRKLRRNGEAHSWAPGLRGRPHRPRIPRPVRHRAPCWTGRSHAEVEFHVEAVPHQKLVETVIIVPKGLSRFGLLSYSAG